MRLALLLGVSLLSVGCIYPELQTPLSAPPNGATLEPDPPADLLFVVFEGAALANRTPDGRTWEGGAPDTFARLVVDGDVVLETPVARKSLSPHWSGQAQANYQIGERAKVRIELWDYNAIVNVPICVSKLDDFAAQSQIGNLSSNCAAGTRIDVRVEPAHARYGLGIHYEAHPGGVLITRVATNSPASRAGIAVDDTIVEIQGKRVSAMVSGQAQSLINTHRREGLKLVVQSPNGKTRHAEIKEGPVYLVKGKDDAFNE